MQKHAQVRALLRTSACISTELRLTELAATLSGRVESSSLCPASTLWHRGSMQQENVPPYFVPGTAMRCDSAPRITPSKMTPLSLSHKEVRAALIQHVHADSTFFWYKTRPGQDGMS